MSCTAIIVAAGKSERFGDPLPKVFQEIKGKPVIAWTLFRFERADVIDEIILVAAEEYVTRATEVVDAAGCVKVCKVVAGGDTRAESVRCGLQTLSATARWVAIHDGARPMVTPADIIRVVESAQKRKAAILAAKATDAVKHVADGVIVRTLPKEQHYLAQTPQVFERELIMRAHAKASADAADDSILVERLGELVTVVEPTSPNPKITFHSDMVLIESLLGEDLNG